MVCSGTGVAIPNNLRDPIRPASRGVRTCGRHSRRTASETARTTPPRRAPERRVKRLSATHVATDDVESALCHTEPMTGSPAALVALARLSTGATRSWSSARATSGSRSRCARPRSASPSSATTSRPARVDALARRPLLRRGRDRRAARGARSSRGYRADHRSGGPRAASTSRSSPCRRRCATACPTSRSSRPPRRDLAPHLAPGRAGRARVDDLPGHDRGAAAARSSKQSGSRAGDRLLPRLLARAHRSRQPEVDVREHAEGRVGRRRRLARGGRGVLRRARRQGRAGRLDRRGRAREAAREHVPARQHRAGQRARDVRPRSRRRHLVGDRRRGHQAVRLHAVHARARRRRPLPARSTRRTSRGGSNAGSATGSASSSSPTTSTAACPTTSCGASQALLNEQRRAVNGSRILLLGLAYKAGHERLARVAGDDRRRATRRARRRRARARRARPDDARLGPPIDASTAPSRSSRRPTSWSCSSPTPTCPTTTSPTTRGSCWTLAVASAVDRSAAKSSERRFRSDSEGDIIVTVRPQLKGNYPTKVDIYVRPS